MSEVIRLVYLGDDLYERSGTVLSSIYTEDGQRYDWGFVSVALKRGASVEIRQGTPEERSVVIGAHVDRGGRWRPEL